MLVLIATFFMTAILPIIVLIVACIKFKTSAKYAFFGTLGFVIPQLFIRLPLLSTPSVNFALATLPSLLQVLLLAFTAALFETGGRFLVFKLFFKSESRLCSSLVAGLAHGGIESIVIVGLAYINNIIFYIALSNVQLATALNIPQEYLTQFSQIMTSTSSSLFLAAGFERIGTIAFHAFISVLLFKYMRAQKTFQGLFICIALHTALDFTLPLLAQVIGTNVMSFLMIAIGAVCIFCIYKIFNNYAHSKIKE